MMDKNLKEEIDKEVAKAQAKILNEHKLKTIDELLVAWDRDVEILEKLKEIKEILESRV